MLRIAVLLIAAQHVTNVLATCYTFNGTDRNTMPDAYANAYRPCSNVVDEVSMCCRYGLDKCVAGGFCYNEGSNTYWRESCTDKSWDSPNCVKLFTTAQDDGGDHTDVKVTNCSDGRWCFGRNNNACCLAREGFFIVDGVPTTQDPSQPTSTSSTALPTNTASSSPSATAAAANTSSSKLSGGAIGGIVVGVVVGIAVLLGIGFWLMKRNKRSEPGNNVENPKVSPTPPQSFAGTAKGYYAGSEMGDNVVHEKDGVQAATTRTRLLGPAEMGT